LEKLIRLRGHHILCLLGFRGLGYSQAFVENLGRVQERAFSSDCTVEVIVSPDDICAACPRLLDAANPCDESRICKKDLSVLRLLSLTPGKTLPAVELYARVRKSIAPEFLQEICSNCRWLDLGYCREGLQRNREVQEK